MALMPNGEWLWVGQTPIPPHVCKATESLCRLRPCRNDESIEDQIPRYGVAVVAPNGESTNPEWMSRMLTVLEQNPIMAVFLLPRQANLAWQMLSRQRGQYLYTAEDAEPHHLSSFFSAAAAVQPIISRLHLRLQNAKTLSAQAARTVEEMGEEMRLAARLQRDFLPRRLPEVGAVRFGALYHPASWVSGDIYDIVRLDERHVGFYVADVVGHGMPAALLTMFIKKAFQTKRIFANAYEIVPPNISLEELNVDICQQNLPSCQFCTAVYCVLDTQTLQLSLCRGGHPEPLVLRANGRVERLQSPGSLLGVFPDEKFSLTRYQLEPGDRMVLYTDGSEPFLFGQNGPEADVIEQSMISWGDLTREEMLLRLTSDIDAACRMGGLQDDVTVLALDVLA